MGKRYKGLIAFCFIISPPYQCANSVEFVFFAKCINELIIVLLVVDMLFMKLF